MDVFTDGTIIIHVGVGRDVSTINLGQLSRNIEGKCAKLLDVDAPACTQIVVQVGHESSPDQLHLQHKE